MLYYWLLFFFLAFGAKVLLALVMIFMLLPSDRTCSQCDEETLLIRAHRLGRFGSALTLRRVQWRWCPRCGWEGLARRVHVAPRPAGRPARHPSPTRS
ncbi:MAG TPA: hypothetical protein VMN39_07820 [Longimicrobiaceae bacterium]|nr:hypothetical protein [Longimicrobiaceae bacterium]